MSSLNQILETIKTSVNRIGSFASKRQDPLLREVLGLVKKLETKGDNIQNNINNLKVLNQIKSKVERLMIDDKYMSEVKSFVQSYNDLQNIHNEYFSKFNAKWKPAKSLNILKNSAIETTINSFTETGIEVGVTDGIKKILLENITNGGSYFDLTEQLRKHITGAEGLEGAVERYVRTYATTSINQFSAEYNKSIADDLGLEWYGYSGSLLETSRDWCEKCVEKKFIHVSEFPALLEGDFGSLGSVKISKSTGLPAGLMKGTNETNLVRRRGGWNCGHQMLAVDDSIVPDNIKNAVYATQAYKNWAAKNGKKSIEGKENAIVPLPVKQEKPTKRPVILEKNKSTLSKIEKDKIDIYDDLFDSLPEELSIEKSNKQEAYYHPIHNKIVIGNFNTAGSNRSPRNNSEYFRATLMAHETGHAIHSQKGIIVTQKAFVREDFANHFDNLRSKIRGKEDEIHVLLENKVRSASQNEREQISVLADILGSLTRGRRGWGHATSYYRTPGMSEAEIFAHSVSFLKKENAFIELHEDLKAVVEEMKAKISDWL